MCEGPRCRYQLSLAWVLLPLVRQGIQRCLQFIESRIMFNVTLFGSFNHCWLVCCCLCVCESLVTDMCLHLPAIRLPSIHTLNHQVSVGCRQVLTVVACAVLWAQNLTQPNAPLRTSRQEASMVKCNSTAIPSCLGHTKVEKDHTHTHTLSGCPRKSSTFPSSKFDVRVSSQTLSCKNEGTCIAGLQCFLLTWGLLENVVLFQGRLD